MIKVVLCVTVMSYRIVRPSWGCYFADMGIISGSILVAFDGQRICFGWGEVGSGKGG